MSRGAQSRSGKNPRKSHTSRPTGTIRDFIGLLAGKTKKVATIEEINEAAAQGWAGKVRVGKK
jgi:hypothetical protein